MAIPDRALSLTHKLMASTKPFSAPGQHAQPSRKGKKAWRKNVDIAPVEQRLEEMREEERVIGCAVVCGPVLTTHALS